LSFVPRILMRSQIPPGPPIKSTLFNVRDVVRYEVVTQGIALTYRAPQLPGLRIHANSTAGVANTVRIHLHFALRRIAIQTVGAILFFRMRIRVIHVRTRPNGYEQLLAVLRELDGSRVVSATREVCNMLRRTSRLGIAAVIWKTD